MKITPAFKTYLVEKHGLGADASEEDAKKLTSEKLFKGELSAEDIVKHSMPVDAKSVVSDMVKTAVSEQVAPELKSINDVLAKLAEKLEGKGTEKPETKATEPAKTPDEVLAEAAEKAAAKALEKLGVKAATRSPFSLLSGARPDVKKMDEIYSSATKSAAFPTKTKNGTPHPFAGQQAWHDGRPLNEKSHLGTAVNGAWFKMMTKRASGSMLPGDLTDHDRELIDYALHEMEFRGHWNSYEPGVDRGDSINGKLADWQVKTLYDTSGQGTEVVPYVWDEAVITIPVLYGELYPMVDQVTLDRGRQIYAASMLNPTVSVTAEFSSTIALNTTAPFFTQIQPVVYPLAGAMELGRDFLADTPVNVGDIVTKAYGYKTLEWLDNMIANGTGSSQPTGLFNGTGITSLLPTFPNNGPVMVSDAEALLFGVPKAVRAANGGRNAFVANDTTYRRFRGVPVGTDDARRVFGMDVESYKLLDTPFKIQNDIPDGRVCYANMGYYRMYRRAGMEIQNVTVGQNVTLRNTILIVARSRWAGAPMLGSAVAAMTTLATSG